MTEKGFIFKRPNSQCDLCGKVAEVRPYGPKGEYVCFPCGMKNEEATKRAFRKKMMWDEGAKNDERDIHWVP